MPTVRLLNWSVQAFGPTKAGMKYGNYDIVAAIARTVVQNAVDLFVMLEVDATSRAAAEELARIVLDALREASTASSDWKQAVLSPGTGGEFYAFFIRDAALTTPVPVTGPLLGVTPRPPRVLGRVPSITSAQFTTAPSSYVGVLDDSFPLLMPDQNQLDPQGRSLGIPPWPGMRRPALGLFKIRGAGAASAYLPIVVCHYASKPTMAVEQFKTLPYFSFLSGLSTNPPAPPVMLTIDGRKYQPKEWILTGDFNVDYNTFAYRTLIGNEQRALGAQAAIHQNTFLVSYGGAVFQPTTASLAVQNLDNFLTRSGPTAAAPLTAASPRVANVPEDVRLGEIRLRASVQHYRELDPRGFVRPHPEVTLNFADQLTNLGTVMNVEGALMGGRLISDHLPTLVDVTVP
ncbi:MAG TPA: hypothetical protein VEO54_02810 [Thermoanaerobaculia bacterium]|nr:hypothetical protein [Thermoanaerobaculia bacterium]